DGECVLLDASAAHCGTCDHACAAGEGCFASACQPIAPPRLVAPLSTATVTSQTPTLRWALPEGVGGAQIEICRHRACTRSVGTFSAPGPRGTAPHLDAGVYFWRARGTHAGAVGTLTSAVWQFRVGARSAAVDTSWGTTPDVNGDGYDDV